MIRRLRIRFVVVAMLSLFAVLAVIMLIVNGLNYRSIVSEADDTLALLKINDGKFPVSDEGGLIKPQPGDAPADDAHAFSPELPYESRFFTVTFSNEGEAVSCNMDHIAAINSDTAVELAEKAYGGSSEKGFVGIYRYIVSDGGNGVMVIFLDCSKMLSTFRTFLLASCGISLAGLAAVFVLIVLLSGRIMKPIAESYDKQKRFVTDAGHEIKTPITIIGADAEMLGMEIGEENEWLRDIRSQTKRLTSLTNDLIFLSRMNEGTAERQAMEFPFSDVASETAQDFQALAKSQNKTLSAEIEPMLTFTGDEKALRQMLSVLLDNAVKYSPENSSIAVRLKKAGKTLRLTVTNETRTPLAKEKLELLFERFYRTDPSRSSETGGYGIGLSVAKAVVTAHKGKITAILEAENTLTIRIILPL